MPPDVVASLSDAIAHAARASRRLVLLDYDGTLVPFASAPHLAYPDPPLLALLTRIARLPGTAVHIVSGRARLNLDSWLGRLPVGLHAEHGYWSKLQGARVWTETDVLATTWRRRVLALMGNVAARIPGALVEEKSVSLTFHYRAAAPGPSAIAVLDLREQIVALGRQDLEILEGAKVLEVRPRGVNKGRVVRPLVDAGGTDTAILAAGDDLTDEDLFAALPAGALSIRVGAAGPSWARTRAASPTDLRRALENLADLVEAMVRRP
jgi:trehalose 6-phosphate synthase/phosphatase